MPRVAAAALRSSAAWSILSRLASYAPGSSTAYALDEQHPIVTQIRELPRRALARRRGPGDRVRAPGERTKVELPRDEAPRGVFSSAETSRAGGMPPRHPIEDIVTSRRRDDGLLQQRARQAAQLMVLQVDTLAPL